MSISRESTDLVEYVGPVDAATGASLAAGVCEFTPYREDGATVIGEYVTYITKDAALGEPLFIPVVDPFPWGTDGTALVTYDNKDVEAHVLGALPETADGLQLGATAVSAISEGAEVRLSIYDKAGGAVSLELIGAVPLINTYFEIAEPGQAKEILLATDIRTSVTQPNPVDGGRSHAVHEVLVIAHGVAFLADVTAGTRVRETFGPAYLNINMPLYQSPLGATVAGDDDWGYRGILSPLLTVRVGDRVRIEIVFDGSNGVDTNTTDVVSWIEVVVD